MDVIRILIVDDHPVFRDGLSFLIDSQPDLQLVAAAGDAAGAVTAFRDVAPDVTLMDLRLGNDDASTCVSAIKRIDPAARIVIVTTSESEADIQRLLKLGVSAYVLKSMATSRLLQVIREVHAGRRVIPSEVATQIGQASLSTRELQVLELIRDGQRSKQIADQLSIAEATVNFHAKNIVQKLGAEDRTHAVVIAIRRGLLHIS